jgi:hypothetical protein
MVNAFLNLQFVTGGSRKAKSQQQKNNNIGESVNNNYKMCILYNRKYTISYAPANYPKSRDITKIVQVESVRKWISDTGK